MMIARKGYFLRRSVAYIASRLKKGEHHRLQKKWAGAWHRDVIDGLPRPQGRKQHGTEKIS